MALFMLLLAREGSRLMKASETEHLMMKRLWRHGVRYATGLATAAAILAPVAANAQIRQVPSTEHRQSIGGTVGWFFPKSEDSRVDGDTIVADLNDLVFDVSDFNGASFSGEWLFAFGKYVESGVSVGYYKRTVPSVYRNFVNANGSEIEQDLKLRIVPINATVRFLPIGHGSVEPYVGGGIGIFNWRYSEAGEFVDSSDGSIFRASYKADGWTAGPVILAGVRVPFGDVWDIGGEIQYQHAHGDTDREQSQLLGDKIDLGGVHALFTMHVRF
jgi:outer membrane protein with beta-barrel domain